MKIDDKARAYFGEYETLERLDDLSTALKAYFRDLDDRLFDVLAARLNELSKRHQGWTVKRSKSTKERSVILHHEATSRYPALEVGFWCDEDDDWACFNEAWLGLIMKGSNSRRREVYGLLSSCFGKPEQDFDYAIFEYFKGWPNLEDDDYISLHRITNDNGKRVADEIVHQIDQIIATLEAGQSRTKRVPRGRRGSSSI